MVHIQTILTDNCFDVVELRLHPGSIARVILGQQPSGDTSIAQRGQDALRTIIRPCPKELVSTAPPSGDGPACPERLPSACRLDEMLVKDDRLRRQPVKVRRFNPLVPVAAEKTQCKTVKRKDNRFHRLKISRRRQ